MEGSDPVTQGGCALGKDDQAVAITQRLAELALQSGTRARATLNEQGASCLSQQAYYRPVPDFSLGQKMDRCMGGYQRNIEPGNVIADQQVGALCNLSMHGNLQGQKHQQSLHPMAHQTLLPDGSLFRAPAMQRKHYHRQYQSDPEPQADGRHSPELSEASR